MDLHRKVSIKPRKNSMKRKSAIERTIVANRKYDDFIKRIELNPNSTIVEMDCVVGLKSEPKVMLTLLWRKSRFMLIFLLEKQNMRNVEKVFKHLQDTLGNELYHKLFEIVLTDRGSEFLNPHSIEFQHKTGEHLSNVFYCDAGAAYQKGTIEKNHEFIRYILPKKSSFENLSQDKCKLIYDNINSICRKELNNHCSFDDMQFFFGDSVLKLLNATKIGANDVNLSKNLIK
jgi:IS30 family transposase